MNPLHVIEGHVNKALSKTALANNDVELLAKERLLICTGCKDGNGNACLNDAERCCRCGCDMQAKTRVLNAKCPIGKW